MKILLFILPFLFLSCGQNETKQKELELKERELALKVKEFATKQNDSVSNKNASTTPIATSTPVETKADAHSDFQIFWVDFKKAINDGNKDAVVSMTNIPFKDKYRESLYKYMPSVGKPLTSKSVDEFKANYDKIFSPAIIKLINSNQFRAWNKNKDVDETGGHAIKKGEYLIQLDNGDGDGLAFSKIGGVYMLSYIPYYDFTVGGM
ncbi:MAG: hypothetical protein IPP81_19995 [Chitinophagaceae bacterium]|nr:hypothetical protein [Chitinophagaceae bacterium]